VKALQPRQAAHSRYSAPPFVLIDGIEVLTLRKLSDLAFRLFFEIVAMDRMGSGRISTTYAVLLSLLDFDAAPGAQRIAKPTVKRIRTALEHLASVGLVLFSHDRNRADKGLFLKVKTREEMSSLRDSKGRQKGRRENSAKQATARASGRRPRSEGQTEGQGIQEAFSYPPTPQQSTGKVLADQLHADGVERERKLRAAAHAPMPAMQSVGAAFEFVADGLNPVPPRGHDTHAAAPRTPPGPSRFVVESRAAVERKKAKDKALRATPAAAELELAAAVDRARPKKTALEE